MNEPIVDVIIASLKSESEKLDEILATMQKINQALETINNKLNE